MPARFEALLLDIDGVLHVGDDATPGGVEAMRTLTESGIPLRLVTNTTSRPRAAVADRLNRLGYDVEETEILTPARMAVQLCHDRGYRRVAVITANALKADLADLEAVVSPGSTVDAVIVGDLGPGFSYGILNGAFRSILRGADLIALQKNRYWRRPEGLVMDAGPFIAALEYATGVEATVVGKPSGEFFAAALNDLGIGATGVAMVGDDLEADVGGAIDAGLAGILVKTGKYRAHEVEESAIEPTMVIDSLADVPALVGHAGSAYT
ncbi:MAG: TIGR01458 family HAD-type hydrolase [Solirubrobacteraceae bacterium]|nr:TIGR01458 family HAD-type hydrolase [Solirubrobacteraceae bacterium]